VARSATESADPAACERESGNYIGAVNFAILGSRGFPSTYSGYETLVRYLAPALSEAGHSVSVYSREPIGKARVWDHDGIRCIATPGLQGKALSTPTFGLTSSIDAVFRDYDAVLVVNIANGFWLPLLRLARTPTAVNTDGIEWERGKWNRTAQSVFRRGAQLCASHASELICDSHGIGDIWSELFGRRSTFIPYGAPVLTDVGSDRLASVGLSDRPFLLSVARLVPENSIDLTLDAIELLGDRDLTPVIVGSSVGPSPIADRLARLAAEEKVIWLGHVSDQELLNQLWANCTVYVHGHSVGGTNPSLLQAMGAGAPTLALDTRFNAEVIDQPEQLYRAEAGDLLARIDWLLDSGSRRAEIAARQRRRIATDYSWDQVCDSYREVLEGLANRSRQS
jgi:glycosyltransferase involved in cell wall biosynthesis